MYGHAMVIEQRPRWMVERWLRQLKRDIRRAIVMWEEGEWDMNLDASCSSYAGCAYMGLCRAKNPLPWIEADYEIRPWNPLATGT